MTERSLEDLLGGNSFQEAFSHAFILPVSKKECTIRRLTGKDMLQVFSLTAAHGSKGVAVFASTVCYIDSKQVGYDRLLALPAEDYVCIMDTIGSELHRIKEGAKPLNV